MKRSTDKTHIFLIVSCMIIFSFHTIKGNAAPFEINSLQSKVDHAKRGEIVHIPSGEYVGPIIVNKELTLVGDGPVEIIGSGKDPIVSLSSAGSQLIHLHIQDRRNDPLVPAILVEGDHHVLRDVAIETQNTGIELHHSDRNQITNIHIVGLMHTGERKFDEGNGIDLDASSYNQLDQIMIDHVHDGIYVENSEGNIIQHSTIQHSRYGIHLMFTKNTVLQNNEGTHNVTGAEIMSTEGTKVLHNHFYKQNEKVYSQGMLLYDVHHATIQHNWLEGNLVGLYLQESSQNFINLNVMDKNFIGIQVIDAKENEIHHNDFIANVNQAEVQNSQQNKVSENFWDDFQGLDINADGYSDLHHRMNPFFLKLVQAYEPFEIFFQSPGMVFLQDMFQVNKSEWMTDTAPAFQPYIYHGGDESSSKSSVVWLSGLLLLLSTTTIILMGVKKR